MSTADELEGVHRLAARVLGPIGFAIAREKVTRRQLVEWATSLEEAADRLRKIAGVPKDDVTEQRGTPD